MPARPTVSEPRRDEVMTAAKKVFARNGFDGTTIADVAKEAGLPFDVVYQYFDSKDALFGALIGAQEHALRTTSRSLWPQAAQASDTRRCRSAPHCGR